MNDQPTPEPEAQMRITDWLREHPRRQYHDAANYIDSLERERDELAESILNLSHPNCQILLRERDEARAQRDRLTEVLQNIRASSWKTAGELRGMARQALNQPEP